MVRRTLSAFCTGTPQSILSLNSRPQVKPEILKLPFSVAKATKIEKHRMILFAAFFRVLRAARPRARKMTIQIGLIGGGNISETHARAALAIPDVRIAAICGSNANKVQHLAQQYGGKPYTDIVEFLDHRPMDFVAIGSPSGLHAKQGIAAAKCGLHVLTEKPIDI